MDRTTSDEWKREAVKDFVRLFLTFYFIIDLREYRRIIKTEYNNDKKIEKNSIIIFSVVHSKETYTQRSSIISNLRQPF